MRGYGSPASLFFMRSRDFIETLQSLTVHLQAFVTAYTFAKHLEALPWRTPFQSICEAWQRNQSAFKIRTTHPGTAHLGLLGSRPQYPQGGGICQPGVAESLLNQRLSSLNWPIARGRLFGSGKEPEKAPVLVSMLLKGGCGYEDHGHGLHPAKSGVDRL